MKTDRRDLLETEPYRFDLFALLRELERASPDKPRVGKAAVTAQEIVRLGQDPFLDFPASNISDFRVEYGKPPSIRSKFLGFFGPQGALPLLTTIEAYRWNDRNDDSFIRFTDIFATRMLQLFYRAWADARPITQFDRPAEDRFAAYVGSMVGIGTSPYRDRDGVPDIAKLPYAGVLGSRVKSASRLEQVLRGILGVEVEIEERKGIWLEFEDSDLSRAGQSGASLGQNTYLGARVYSINDKALIKIRTEDVEDYRTFLPGGPQFQRLADLVHFYLGDTVDFDLQLALPKANRPAAQLGQSGQLGWTSWSAPEDGEPGEYIADATFSLHQSGAP
ncbi:type VI secretion system baseplate subunit TssG [Actibacterium sp. 188UL27-1]|uniref:type VI secretion system baseplate subunit TssG n=1 Tax=Actibacterium sp. 188UL27-1 TaxID=2786961 RepID=UPI0019585868|nr:type VI secretion system baseplate subunit TssG [Actibacterium sp. 188UL27-1]MBM7068824.1 type VI secretion system baseplate subunit TssG [Actibacterium sp. 188UL27-1]